MALQSLKKGIWMNKYIKFKKRYPAEYHFGISALKTCPVTGKFGRNEVYSNKWINEVRAQHLTERTHPDWKKFRRYDLKLAWDKHRGIKEWMSALIINGKVVDVH